MMNIMIDNNKKHTLVMRSCAGSIANEPVISAIGSGIHEPYNRLTSAGIVKVPSSFVDSLCTGSG